MVRILLQPSIALYPCLRSAAASFAMLPYIVVIVFPSLIERTPSQIHDDGIAEETLVATEADIFVLIEDIENGSSDIRIVRNIIVVESRYANHFVPVIKFVLLSDSFRNPATGFIE